VIRTDRLELVPATIESITGALASKRALGAILGADVPEGWPPEFLDDDALRWTIARLKEQPEQPGWWLYFVLLVDGSIRTLIGSAGYKGPPDTEGSVEIGYGIVAEYHRRGYASEAARGLIERAFADAAVQRVLAETYPSLVASIGVLRACGFQFIGDGSEPGVIRFELTREHYLQRST
jgi:ribosomal-protein-alanine N-acetyltransferase